jgi:hypothetical protein
MGAETPGTVAGFQWLVAMSRARRVPALSCPLPICRWRLENRAGGRGLGLGPGTRTGITPGAGGVSAGGEGLGPVALVLAVGARGMADGIECGWARRMLVLAGRS